jgi:hypothetical protein
VLHLQLIILSVGAGVPVDNETLLATDFMNLKIKPAQSFRGAHRDKMCVCVYMSECSYMYEYLHLYCVSKKHSHEVLVNMDRLPTKQHASELRIK